MSETERERERERRERERGGGGEGGGGGAANFSHLFLRVLFLSMLPSDALLKSVLTSLLEDVFTASTSVSGRVSLFFSKNPSATYLTCSTYVKNNAPYLLYYNSLIWLTNQE